MFQSLPIPQKNLVADAPELPLMQSALKLFCSPLGNPAAQMCKPKLFDFPGCGRWPG